MRTGLVVMLASVLALEAAEITQTDHAAYLTLEQASCWQVRDGRLFDAKRDAVVKRDVRIELRRRGGELEPTIWVHHPVKLGQWTPVAVDVQEEGADKLSFICTVDLPPIGSGPGGIVTGGRCRWHVELEWVAADEAWQGSYTGTVQNTFDWSQERELTLAFDLDSHAPGAHSKSVRGQLGGTVADAEVAGAVTARMAPLPRRSTGTGVVTTPGQHPRLIFTKEELPDLRARVASGEGQKIMAEVDELLSRMVNGFGFKVRDGQAEHSMQSLWSVGLGLKYQLTGDQQYADRARGLVWQGMYSSLPDKNQWRQSHRIVGVALTYDLCCEAWPQDFRDNVYDYLLGHALNFSRRRDIRDPLNIGDLYTYGGQTESFVRTEDHVESRKYIAAAGLCAMAIMGDEPPVYRPKPLAEARVIDPEPGFEPLAGVPVVDLYGGHMFKRWLINGPFVKDGRDPLASLGGLARARPVPGTTVQQFGVDLDFRHYIANSEQNLRRGPHIYPRNCGKYYTNSTGNGYWPGRKVAKSAKERGLASNAITLYTVWDNPDEQYIQAFPNHYWQSRNVRMWLAGVEVRDEEIIRVRPGYYPVMLHIPVTGGYSTQAPHLAWYSIEQYEEEETRYQACQQLLASFEGGLPRVLAQSIGRELRHFMLTEMDRRGWNAASFPDHLMPFLHAWRRCFGEDLCSDTGVEQIVPVAAFGRGQYQSYNSAYVLAHAFPFLSDQERRVARWYLDRYGYGFRRPIDYLIPLVTQDLQAEPLHPREVYPLVQHFPDVNVYAFNRRHERQPEQSFSVLVDAGGPLTSPSGAMAVELSGIRVDRRGGNGWWRGLGHDHLWQHDNGSVPYAQDYYNTQPARLVHYAAEEDGSGVVSYELGPLQKGRVLTDGRRRLQLTEVRPGTSILRSVLVDYSAASGAPVVVILADRYRGFGEHVGKYLQFFSGMRFDRIEFAQGEAAFAMVQKMPDNRRKIQAALNAKIFAPRKIEFRKFTRNKENTVGIIQAVVDRRRAAAERAADLKTQDLQETEGDLEDALEDLKLSDDVVLEEGSDVAIAGDDLVIYTILTIAADKPPRIEADGHGVGATLGVGSRRYLFDGEKLGVKQ